MSVVILYHNYATLSIRLYASDKKYSSFIIHCCCIIKLDTPRSKGYTKTRMVKEMSEAKKYDRSYKEQSVKLALEIGVKRASEELKVPYGTLYGWVQAAKNGDLDIEERTPENAMSLAEEIRQLRSEVKRLNKENKRLQEERDFLNEAAAFFAASRRK